MTGVQTCALPISLRNHLDVVNANVILAKPGTKEYIAAEEAVKSTKEQLAAAYEKDSVLVEERKNINAVQCVQQTQTEQERATEYENNEHLDDRREERVDEHDPDKMTMEEAKGVIEEEKAKDGAKGMDVKDREVAEPTKIKAPKSKPDRAD